MIYNLYENYQSAQPIGTNTDSDVPSTCREILNGDFNLPLLYGSDDNEGCFLDDKFFTTYNFTQLRDENLQKYDIVYSKIINGITEYNENEKHEKILCLMEEMFSDIEKVNKYNKEKTIEIEETKKNKKDNNSLIKEHKEKLEKHENYNLIKQNRIINTENNFYKKKLEYNIYLWFIVIFILIQLLLLIIIL
jgi:hypothetical protein